MHRESRSFIAALRLACLAMLLSALAPALSSGLTTAQSGPGWDDICVTPGPNGGTSDRPGAPLHLTQCPYCLPHGGTWAPPPQTTPLPIQGGIAHEPPRLVPHGPTPRDGWIAPQPRAPPPLIGFSA